jgi:hypothetical protein
VAGTVALGPEIHHVEGTDRADIGDARLDHGLEPVLARGQHAAHEEIGDLGRGEVEHRLDEAALDQLLDACPPVPVAWKTRQSWSASSARVTAWTQGVVTRTW